jgi:tetratricopeptide (TPR) repeat protein
MKKILKHLLLISLLLFICCSVKAQFISEEYIDDAYFFTIELDYQIAIDSLSELIDLDPSNPELYYYRAWCHFNNSKIALAYDDASKCIKSPLNRHLYNTNILMGKIHSARFAPSLAIQSFDYSISIDDRRPDAYLEKSKLYANQKNHELGIPFIKKAIKKFPEQNELHLYSGLLYMYINNTKKAIPEFQIILNAQKFQDTVKLVAAYFGTSKCNLNNKDYPQALEFVSKGLNLAPDNIAGYGLLGEILYNQQDYKEALIAFNKFEEKRQDAYYWGMIGAIHESQENLELACAYYGKKCNLFRNDTYSCSKFRKLNCKN